ncbi:MAG: BMC domain-containing protein [Acidobacteriota bacterium]
MNQGHGNAIGIVETSSIAKGFEIADAILKTARVEVVVNRTICPGKYMVLVGGDVDAVQSSIDAGVRIGAHTVVDHFVIPNLHPAVFPAVSGVAHLPELNALGVVEGFSVASVIEAADAAVKAAPVQLVTIHLAMAIGGKGFVSMTGDVASVTEAVRVAAAVIERRGLLVEKVVIPAPRPEIVREFV